MYLSVHFDLSSYLIFYLFKLEGSMSYLYFFMAVVRGECKGEGRS